MVENRYATLKEVARRWGIPVSWLYERSRRDQLPGQRRLGRHIRIDLNEFEEKVKDGILAEAGRGGQG
jgi:predicted DNA-binding transcriptional regulator AlpA